MKMTKTDILIVTLALIYTIILGLIFISLLTDIRTIFANKIPANTYLEYILDRLIYIGKYKTHSLQVCKIVNSEENDYRVMNGRWGNSIEMHFSQNGTNLCTFSSYTEMRDGVAYEYEKAGCPPIEKCEVIFGGEKK